MCGVGWRSIDIDIRPAFITTGARWFAGSLCTEPVLCILLTQYGLETSRDMEKAIEELIQKDLMEALVGEDGLFYYELTEKGRKYAEKLRGGSWPFNLLDHDEGGELGSTDGENDDCDE